MDLFRQDELFSETGRFTAGIAPDYSRTDGRIGWHPTPQMDLQLFFGKRRGGTACDHGFCIEVLDFEGMELRLETRW